MAEGIREPGFIYSEENKVRQIGLLPPDVDEDGI